MSGFIFVPIVRVRNVGFWAIVRNVVCTICRGAIKGNVLFLCAHFKHLQSALFSGREQNHFD